MKKNWHGWLYLLPTLIGLVVMIYGPVLVVFGLGFTNYDVLKPPVWKGLSNYAAVLSDPLFYRVLVNTTYFTFASGILSVVLALALALAVSAKLRGIGFFRTVFFVPASQVATATSKATPSLKVYGVRSLAQVLRVLRRPGGAGPPGGAGGG